MRLRVSSALSVSAAGRGSPRWCSQYSKTYSKDKVGVAIRGDERRYRHSSPHSLSSKRWTKRWVKEWAGHSPQHLHEQRGKARRDQYVVFNGTTDA